MIEEPVALTIKKNRNRPTAAQIAGFQGVATGFVVDALGGRGQLHCSVTPIGDGRDIECIAAGPALTAGCGPADILAIQAALNFIQPGDILIAAFDGHQGCAAVGDRVMGMLKNNKAAGFVTDGPARDYPGIVSVGLPIWCTGLTPGTPFSKGPGTVGLPVQLAGQRVENGDMIVADRDGVVVVPFEQIDSVLVALKQIMISEQALDEKVANGQKVYPHIEQLLGSEETKYTE